MLTFLAENAIAAFISIAATVLATFLVRKVGMIMDAIETKANVEIDQKLQERVQDTVRRVVMAISQTYVSGLKKSGKFDETKQKEALQKAISEAGKIIFEEIGVCKTPEELQVAVEAEIGEQKQIENVVKAVSNESKGRTKKK